MFTKNFILLGRKTKDGKIEVMHSCSLESLTDYGLNHYIQFAIYNGTTLKRLYRYADPTVFTADEMKILMK
jgi:hypothetical protein